MSACTSRLLKSTLAAVTAGMTFFTGLPPSMAADHGDAPFVSGSMRNADLGDPFLFLDPNDNNLLVIADPARVYPRRGGRQFLRIRSRADVRFEFETTGNARPDRLIPSDFLARSPPASRLRLPPSSSSGATVGD